MKIIWQAMPVAAAMALILPAALAAPEKKDACKADAEKFCSNVEPGEGRIIKCLSQHKDQLSGACKEQGQQTAQKLQDFEQACRPDIEKLCANVKPGGGRHLQCLKQHESNLSPACSERLLPPRGH